VVGEADKAVHAFATGLAGEPRNIGLAMEYAEATLHAAPATGVARLPAQTGDALQALLRVDEKNWQALWLLGLDALAAGDMAGARERWQRALTVGTLGPARQDMVRRRLAATGGAR
jgi:cytochrome c-type biogenesis protein CcmH/NrfG